MNAIQRPCFGLVLLAAGRSQRMGRPKLLLPWGQTSILGHLLQQWAALGAHQIGVVCAAGDEVMQRELDQLHFSADNRIVNPAPERGMWSSLQCAAVWQGWPLEISHVTIALGDQPHLREQTLRALVNASTANPAAICQPRFAGRAKHPVILPRAVFAGLGSSKAVTLKEYLEQFTSPIVYCDSEDTGLDLDIDRPEDYQRALALYHSTITVGQTGKRPHSAP
jgi:molybdenum cofactor cytidylyltransferase